MKMYMIVIYLKPLGGHSGKPHSGYCSDPEYSDDEYDSYDYEIMHHYYPIVKLDYPDSVPQSAKPSHKFQKSQDMYSCCKYSREEYTLDKVEIVPR